MIILDEPTIGLDPNQIRSVRQLIKSLAGKHTVLISTHILPEVEMTCNRVLILRDGKILASDTAESLQKAMADGRQIIAEISAPAAELKACWEAVPKIEYFDVSPTDGDFHRCALTPRDGEDLRATVFMLVKEKGWVLRELSRSKYSLEDIYVRVTRGEGEEEEAT